MVIRVYILFDPRQELGIEDRIRYVGQTKQDLSKRLYQHIVKCKSPSQKQHYVNYWISTLLEKNLRPQIVEIDKCNTRGEADKKEQEYINKLQKMNYKICNLTSGGDGHFTMSIETRKKMSKSHKGKKNHFYGRKHTALSKERISKANKGKRAWNKDIPANAEHMKLMRDLANTSSAKQKRISAISKHWHFLDPRGTIVEIINLAEFCRNNNLNVAAMNDLYHNVRHRKSYKGWRRLDTNP